TFPIALFHVDAEEPDQGFGSRFSGLFKRGGEPVMSLREVPELEKQVSDLGGDCRGRTDPVHVQVSVDRVLVKVAALFKLGERIPSGGVVEVVGQMNAVVAG